MINDEQLLQWVQANHVALRQLALSDQDLRVYVAIDGDSIGQPRLLPHLVSLVPRQDPEDSIAITFVEQSPHRAEYRVVTIPLR